MRFRPASALNRLVGFYRALRAGLNSFNASGMH